VFIAHTVQLLVRLFKRIKVAVKKPALKAIHTYNSH
jgi:hypothetical protein